MSAPIAFGALILLAIVSMVGDRQPEPGADGADLTWWQGILLEVAIPIQKALAAPADAFGNTWRSYVDLVGVRADNEQLNARIAELEEENLQYREALVASRHLERIASMRDDFETPMLPAEVVGLDVTPWFRSVLIDRGHEHGVLAGQPVITAKGVVGLVTRTSPHAAKTMLVLDRQSRIDAVVQRSRARGVVHGRGTNQLMFEIVARGADVEVGDVLITSGMAGVYPKGLRIGEVVEIKDPGGSLMQAVLIEPAVDFGRLEQTFVLLRRGPTMALLYGTNTPEGLERDSAKDRKAHEAARASEAGADRPAS